MTPNFLSDALAAGNMAGGFFATIVGWGPQIIPCIASICQM